MKRLSRYVGTAVLSAAMLFCSSCGGEDNSAVIQNQKHYEEHTRSSDNSKTDTQEQRIMFDMETKTVMLNSGYEMPILGLGTWTQDDDTAENSVYEALKDGYRLIDTAQYYGNETGVGKGIQKAIDDGIVTREEVFVTTKVMPSNYDRAYSSIDDLLERLGLDYIDLMLIHQSGGNDTGFAESGSYT
jgi:hypothetical protein